MEIDRATLRRSDGKSAVFLPEQAKRNLWCIFPDDRMPAKYRNDRPSDEQGYPMTASLFGSAGRVAVKMNADFQRKFLEMNPGLNKKIWGDLVDTYSNLGNRPRDCADYINGWRLDKPDPSFPYLVTFGMTFVNVIRENIEWDGTLGVAKGEIVHEIEAIEIDKIGSVSPYYFGNEHLITAQVLGLPVSYEGRLRRNPYVQNGGRNPGGIPTFTPRVKYPGEHLYIIAGKTFKATEAMLDDIYNPVFDFRERYNSRIG